MFFKNIHIRIKIIVLIIIFLFLLIIGKVFYIQVIDYKKLNEFRNKAFDNVEIDWYCKGGITIDQLANQFE